MDSKPVSIVSLFCGCGGMTLGAWEAARVFGSRTDIRLAVDISAEAIKVYRANFGLDGKSARHEDIRSLLPGNFGKALEPIEREIKTQVGRIDLLIAGPPCQGHSDLNNNTRRNDPRNILYLKVVRAAEIFRPTAVGTACWSRDKRIRRVFYLLFGVLIVMTLFGMVGQIAMGLVAMSHALG